MRLIDCVLVRCGCFLGLMIGAVRAEQADVVIYGATPAGIAAAIAAAMGGESVLLADWIRAAYALVRASQ